MKIRKFLRESAIYRIQRLHRAVEWETGAKLRPLGLSLVQALVLSAIHFDEERARPSDIARTFLLTKSQTSQILSHLEAKHYIKRVVDPDDARSYRLKTRPEQRRHVMAAVGVLEKAEKGAERLWKSQV